jgi:hypothetical protein
LQPFRIRIPAGAEIRCCISTLTQVRRRDAINAGVREVWRQFRNQRLRELPALEILVIDSQLVVSDEVAIIVTVERPGHQADLPPVCVDGTLEDDDLLVPFEDVTFGREPAPSDDVTLELDTVRPVGA